MTTERHLTWENFERDILLPGVPAAEPIAGTPEVHIVYMTEPARLGLKVALASPTRVPPSVYEEIEVLTQVGSGGLALAVWTANESLFRPFFSLLLEIADAVQLERQPPQDAVHVAIGRFARVIRRESVFSLEQTLGLWGELFVLEHLLHREGTAAINCWHGWRGDQHDLRIAGTELEVKTTLSASPEHLINGVEQLVASEGHNLYLVSLQLTRSSQGRSLPERVDRIKSLLIPDPIAAGVFDEALSKLHLTSSRLAASLDQFTLRREPWLVPVDGRLPRLTPEVLLPVLGSDVYARLSDAHYRVNVAGLHHGPASPLFQRVIPWMVSDEH